MLFDFNDAELSEIEKPIFDDSPQLTTTPTRLLFAASALESSREVDEYLDKLDELNVRYKEYSKVKSTGDGADLKPTETAKDVHEFLWHRKDGKKWTTYPDRYEEGQYFISEAIDRQIEYKSGVGDGIALSALEMSLGLMNGAFYNTIFVRAHDVKHLKGDRDHILLRAKEKQKGHGRVLNIDPTSHYQTGLYIGSQVKSDELYTPYDLAALIYDCRGCEEVNGGNTEEGLICFRKALAVSRTKSHIRINTAVALRMLGRDEEAEKCYPDLSELEEKKAAKGGEVTIRAYCT